MVRHDASDLAARLGRQAEAVCRHYLSAGHRSGRYWIVGDPQNTPGRSMFVRLVGPATGKGAAGKWTDAQSGAHGDLLDVIREALGLSEFREVVEEARRFLSLPQSEPEGPKQNRSVSPASAGSPEAARRLFAMSMPIAGTLAETYLRGRGIMAMHGTESLRFHPSCYYRPESHVPTETRPAMVASVTDLAGRQTGAHRTWLASDGSGKASVATPRRAMGELLGHGVRFGIADDVLAAGEGIETVLSVRMALPAMPMLAALSAAHLAAIVFPRSLKRLYVIRDRDPAGDGAQDSLIARATDAGIETIGLVPAGGDFNDDLRALGIDAIQVALEAQFHREDISRFAET